MEGVEGLCNGSIFLCIMEFKFIGERGENGDE